jgi:hypothetical protein
MNDSTDGGHRVRTSFNPKGNGLLMNGASAKPGDTQLVTSWDENGTPWEELRVCLNGRTGVGL